MGDSNTRAALADALDRLAIAILQSGPSVIGMSVSATAGPGGGSVTGMRINVTGGPGSGNATGLVVSATANQPARSNDALIQELKEASQTIKSGGGGPVWIQGLLSRVADIGGQAIASAVGAASNAAASYFGSSG
jgi:hypothetical protein